MDSVVQQSAANSQETSSAAEELAGQAVGLAGMVGDFQLTRIAARHQAAAPAARQARSVPRQLPAAAHGSNGSSLLIPAIGDQAFAGF